MKKILLLISTIFLLVLSFFAQSASKQHKYFEKDYQKHWCNSHHGATEVVLPDKTRVDCVTKNYAIEFDFAKKWAESIGQALYYAKMLNKKPGVVLIVEDKTKDQKYIQRISKVSESVGITLWFIYPHNLNNK